MSRKLGIYKRVPLTGIDGWGDECYLIFRPFRFEHLETIIKFYAAEKKDTAENPDEKGLTENKARMTRELIGALKEVFVEGKVKDMDGKVIDAEADDVDDLFLAIGNDIMSGMYGLQDPKSSTASTK